MCVSNDGEDNQKGLEPEEEIEELETISLEDALGRMFGGMHETMRIMDEFGIDDEIFEVGGFDNEDEK